MAEGVPLKLPGWTRRPAELTPRLDLWAAATLPVAPGTAVFRHGSNDVAYKMIGGAYGVLGAEVLGQYVPEAAGTERWGIYVREAGVAWVCAQLLRTNAGAVALPADLPQRAARAIAVHHLLHHQVATATIATQGSAAYLSQLREHSPRHSAKEETLAELMFRAEAKAGLIGTELAALSLALDALTATAPERLSGQDASAREELVRTLTRELGLAETAHSRGSAVGAAQVPHYLVIEPHLPAATASAVQAALLPTS